MADGLVIEKQTTLDLLPTNEPALSATSDVPIIETKPDSTPAEKVVPAAEVKEEPKTEDSAPPVEATEDSSAAPDEAKKPAKGVQKRIDELTRQREDERRAREAAEARLDRLFGILEKPAKQPDLNTEIKEPVKPVSTDFANPEAFDAAVLDYSEKMTDWKVKKGIEEFKASEQKRLASEAQNAQVKTLQENFTKREETVRQKYADYSTVAESPDVIVSLPMAQAIFSSEQGPELKYFLGKNPDEAKRISGMTTKMIDQQGQIIDVPDVARQLVELGKIEARLTTPAPVTKPVSAAPKPITPISKATEASPTPEEETMDQYAARRKKELNSVRPGVRH